MAFSRDDGVTFVLTSCGRFDLLERTLRSFLARNTHPVARWIITEDSGDERVHDVLAELGPRFQVFLNREKLGQVRSVDLAYAAVETPFIFHCEDDWVFTRSGFIEESLALLKAHPAISAVLARGIGERDRRELDLSGLDEWVRSAPSARCHAVPPEAHRSWYGFSFNPGLRRTADMRAAGSFAKLGHERQASIHFKRRGMSVAMLTPGACRHIGDNRRVEDPRRPQWWQKPWLSVKARATG
jgi:hypothetical protein